MICHENQSLRTKLIDSLYHSISSETPISKDDMLKHINLDGLLNLLEQKQAQPSKFNVKPSKFNVKPTINKEKKPVIIKRKKTMFQKFTAICDRNKIHYFRYNSEFGWIGPAIKIFEEQYDELYPKFDSIPTEIQHGTGFIIVHPSVFMNDKNIKYKVLSITPENSDESEEEGEFDTIPWRYDGVLYDLNESNNNVYCRQTQSFVGKRNELDRLDKSVAESL